MSVGMGIRQVLECFGRLQPAGVQHFSGGPHTPPFPGRSMLPVSVTLPLPMGKFQAAAEIFRH
jgi:hypothetical protein